MAEFKTLFSKPLDRLRLRNLARRDRTFLTGPQPLGNYDTPRDLAHQLIFHEVCAECGLSVRLMQCVSIVLNYFSYLTTIPRNRSKIDVSSRTIRPIHMAVHSSTIAQRLYEHSLVFEKETQLKWEQALEAAQREGPDAYAKVQAKYEMSLDAMTRKILYSCVLYFLEATHVLTRADNGKYEPHKCAMAYYFDRGAAANCHEWMVRAGILTRNAAKNKVFGTFTAEEMAKGRAWCDRAGERNLAFKRHMQELVGLCVVGRDCKISMDQLLGLLLKGNQRVPEWAIWACVQSYFYDNHPELCLIQENIERINALETIDTLHLQSRLKLRYAKETKVYSAEWKLATGASFRATSPYAYAVVSKKALLAQAESKKIFKVDMPACRFSLCYLCTYGHWPDEDLYASINAELGQPAFASKVERDRFKRDVNVAVSCYDLQEAAALYAIRRHAHSADAVTARFDYLMQLRKAVLKVCGGIPSNTYYPLESFFTTTAHLYLLEHGIKHVGYKYDGLDIFECEACTCAKKAHQLFREALEYAQQQFLANGFDKIYRERFADGTIFQSNLDTLEGRGVVELYPNSFPRQICRVGVERVPF